jgi:hypothetical protein
MPRLFVEQLTVLDFSRLDPERGLVGESWIADLELGGELDEQSMVLDFGRVKPLARNAMEALADHKLVVPGGADGITMARRGESLDLRLAGPSGFRLRSPAEAVCWLPDAAVTRTGLARHLEAAVRAVVPANVTDVAVALREEDLPGAYYRYSHGLKRHDGNCQRIAHGHRSRVEVWRDGGRSERWERYWAERWRDIYLGSREDLLAEESLAGAPALRFGYSAGEGAFELVLPSDRCELVPSDSTVECLARHMADELARLDPGHRFRVRAYEGVQKGAIAEAG